MRTGLDIFRDPSGTFKSLEKEMGSLLENLKEFPQKAREKIDNMLRAPVCDLRETEKHYLYSFELPGVAKEDLTVEIQGGTLIVAGERKKEIRGTAKRGEYEEKQYGHFQRSLSLPEDALTEKVEASFNAGVLRIAIPRKSQPKKAAIKIGEAKEGWWDTLLEKSSAKSEPISKESKKGESTKNAA